MAADPKRTPFTLPILDPSQPAAPAADDGATPSLGQLGKYELISLLAKGGMGEVYLARARGIAGFEKLVVIKRNLPTISVDREPLFAEARIAATLQHTNIVQVYDVDTDGATVFMAMEFLHGQDVRHVLRRLRDGGGGPLPLDPAIAIAQAVCAGLHYAHDRRDGDGTPLGIVHRDVSPSNVFVTYDGGVKLIDFGLAKATALPSETQLGTIKGKLGYMSPEQCRGEPLDRRSDVFCIGIMLYEMTTGRRPFDADNEYLICKQICEEAPRRPTALDASYPPELEAIVLRAMSKDRRARHGTAGALQEELARLARERRLEVSQWALGQYMAGLFRAELDAWHEAQRTGQSLAEHVVRRVTATVPALAPIEAHGTGVTLSAPAPIEAHGTGGTLPAPAPVPATPGSGPRGLRRWKLAVLAGAVAGAGALALLAAGESTARRGDPAADSPPAANRSEGSAGGAALAVPGTPPGAPPAAPGAGSSAPCAPAAAPGAGSSAPPAAPGAGPSAPPAAPGGAPSTPPAAPGAGAAEAGGSGSSSQVAPPPVAPRAQASPRPDRAAAPRPRPKKPPERPRPARGPDDPIIED